MNRRPLRRFSFRLCPTIIRLALFAGCPLSAADLTFWLSGNTLNWTAVPELSNRLVGAVVGAGMLRRNGNYV